jgi:hypothetical protein
MLVTAVLAATQQMEPSTLLLGLILGQLLLKNPPLLEHRHVGHTLRLGHSIPLIPEAALHRPGRYPGKPPSQTQSNQDARSGLHQYTGGRSRAEDALVAIAPAGSRERKRTVPGCSPGNSSVMSSSLIRDVRCGVPACSCCDRTRSRTSRSAQHAGHCILRLHRLGQRRHTRDKLRHHLIHSPSIVAGSDTMKSPRALTDLLAPSRGSRRRSLGLGLARLQSTTGADYPAVVGYAGQAVTLPGVLRHP